jgi:hypothetical protein
MLWEERPNYLSNKQRTQIHAITDIFPRTPGRFREPQVGNHWSTAQLLFGVATGRTSLPELKP